MWACAAHVSLTNPPSTPQILRGSCYKKNVILIHFKCIQFCTDIKPFVPVSSVLLAKTKNI